MTKQFQGRSIVRLDGYLTYTPNRDHRFTIQPMHAHTPIVIQYALQGIEDLLIAVTPAHGAKSLHPHNHRHHDCQV